MCFFWVIFIAFLIGGFTPNRGIVVRDLILSITWIVGVFEAIIINLGLNLSKYLMVLWTIWKRSFCDFFPYGKFALSAK